MRGVLESVRSSPAYAHNLSAIRASSSDDATPCATIASTIASNVIGASALRRPATRSAAQSEFDVDEAGFALHPRQLRTDVRIGAARQHHCVVHFDELLERVRRGIPVVTGAVDVLDHEEPAGSSRPARFAARPPRREMREQEQRVDHVDCRRRHRQRSVAGTRCCGARLRSPPRRRGRARSRRCRHRPRSRHGRCREFPRHVATAATDVEATAPNDRRAVPTPRGSRATSA